MHSRARVDADPAKMNKNFIILCGLQHQGWEEKGGMWREKSRLVAAASLPTETASRLTASHVRDRINTGFVHFPAAMTAARWVVGGTGISACLPPGLSFQTAEENCCRAGGSPTKVRR